MVHIPLFTWFYTSKRWLGMGFLNHQQLAPLLVPSAPSVHEFHDHTGVPKSRKLGSQEPRPTAGFTVADVIHPGETPKKINHFSATEKKQ